MAPDEAALLERWTRRRDAEAFNELFRRFAGPVYSTCRRILGNDADAEEVAQECFLLLVRSHGSVQTSLGGWHHSVATTRSLNRIRHERRRREREQIHASTLPHAVESSWDDIQIHVDGAIETLRGDTREMIIAHFLEGKSHGEIAADHGLGRRAVSARIQRGLESVRQELVQRGVTVSAVALGPMLAQGGYAAPASLQVALGKLAIAAGPGVSGGGWLTAVGSVLAMKAKVGIGIGVVCLIAVGYVLLRPGGDVETAVVSVPQPIETEQTPATAPSPEAVATDAPPLVTANVAGSTTVREEPDRGLEALLALSETSHDQTWQGYPVIEDEASFATVSGSVVDQNGYGISGAVIRLVPADWWGHFPGVQTLDEQVTSRADGTYTIEGIDHSGRYWISASKAGFAGGVMGESRDVALRIAAGEAYNGVNFVLAKGPMLRGRVVTEDGAPVGNAVVMQVSSNTPNRMGMETGSSARTDERGQFSMGFPEELRGSIVGFRVMSDAHGTVSFPAIEIQEGDVVDFRMPAPAIVHGAVKSSDGTVASGAWLYFYGSASFTLERGSSEDGWQGVSFAGSTTAVCDEAGRYAVELTPGLDYEVEVRQAPSLQGIYERETLAPLEPGERRQFDVVINTNTISIHGRIVNARTGEPFDSYVTMAQVQARRNGEWAGNCHMGAESTFALELPPNPGTYELQASYAFDADVSGLTMGPYDLAEGDSLEVDIPLPGPQYFQVRAVDSAGTPLGGVVVSCITPDGRTFNPNAFTNDEGRLAAPLMLPPQSGYRLRLQLAGYAIGWGTQYENQEPDTVHPEETIVMWPGAGFEGDVVDGDGNPVVNAALTVTVTNRDGQVWPLAASTDGFGHFTIVDEAPADAVEVSVGLADGGLGTWSGSATLVERTITGLGTLRLE